MKKVPKRYAVLADLIGYIIVALIFATVAIFIGQNSLFSIGLFCFIVMSLLFNIHLGIKRFISILEDQI